MRLLQAESRFSEIYRIYEASFPETERRTFEEQLKTVNNPSYHLLVREENGEILAFLGYWDLPSCIFIEHLATDQACRGKGYGRDLVIECISEVKKPVFLEIEPVDSIQDMKARRKAFYERLGFVCQPFFYQQPPLMAGQPWIPLWIMSHGQAVSENEFEAYKKEIYQIVYKI